jgi:hypothetical protein
LIKPSQTDPRITLADTPHLVKYNPSIKSNKLLVFIPGSNGIAQKSAPQFLATAIEQGYRVISLSYVNFPAISTTCVGKTLQNDSDCAEKFRNYRAFGIGEFPLVKDKPFDAINNRLIKLLQYLTKVDETGNWSQYLMGDNLVWKRIALAGQSQGGGMACFIAKKYSVNRALTFSGGWDFSEKDKIAEWYKNTSATAKNKYFGAYHELEPAANFIRQSYVAMQIPKDQLFALDKEVPTRLLAHGQSVSNRIYKDIWIQMLTK